MTGDLLTGPEFAAKAPDMERLAGLHAGWRRAASDGSAAEALTALRAWDHERRSVATWVSLCHLRFRQDTRDEAAKAALELCDELSPAIRELDVGLQRALLDSPRRAALEAEFGGQAFALWAANVAGFDPAIQDDLRAESARVNEYVELLSGARIPFDGAELNLSEMQARRTAPDRQARHAADRAYWGWFADNAAALDAQFDDLVGIRTRMAKAVGKDDYVALGYLERSRIGYDRGDVERFRAEVLREVVPLATELRARQAANLGLAPGGLMAWDEAVHDPAGNPAPAGDHDWMLDQASAMFDALHPEMGSFFSMMRRRQLLDLKARKGKAGGGFCTAFEEHDVPYVFANFNGTKADVEVFTHECGHAFQGWSSASKMPLVDYLFPTYEGAEVHSMSLEFLTYPEMERFFSPASEADRFRKLHLTESLLFLPYGCAVDDFQHRVYAAAGAAGPDDPAGAAAAAAAAERHQMWLDVEALWLPWRQWGDLDHPAKGGRWQAQRHIYAYPFYYIDYVLAQTCALQFWAWAEADRPAALQAYVALCHRGGALPFQELVRSAGLRSPFEEGCLATAVAAARAVLLPD